MEATGNSLSAQGKASFVKAKKRSEGGGKGEWKCEKNTIGKKKHPRLQELSG